MGIFKMVKQQIQNFRDNIKQTFLFYSNIPFLTDNVINDYLEERQKEVDNLLDKILKIAEIEINNKQLKTSIQNTLSLFNDKIYQLRISQEINELQNDYLSRIQQGYEHFLKNFSNDIDRIEYLQMIKDSNVIIVGGNGVGKSQFASYLKNALSDNIVLIPAQKYLYADFSQLYQFLTADVKRVHDIQKQDLSSEAKQTNSLSNYNNKSTMLFAQLMTALINEHLLKQSQYTGKLSDLNTQLTVLKNVWKIMFPDIELVEDVINRTLSVQKGDFNYSINEMSDGEKAVLYYMLQILFVPPKSFVFVDEPETYLNSSISNRLWNTLEASRKDVKFVYISHNVNFIASRKNTDILWVKNFSYPNKWELQPLKNSKLPRELMSELAGIKKPIIFVEGTISSYDYNLFTSMFNDKAIVIPVGGHTNVINYTKAYNDDSVFNDGKAFGIVDNDLRNDNEIDKLKRSSVYVLPFNEIEMLYFEEELMKNFLSDLSYDSEIITTRINHFKEEFFKAVSNKFDLIKEAKAKKTLDTYISNQKVEKFAGKTAEQMVLDVIDKINGIDLPNYIEAFGIKLKATIDSRDYQNLLILSPLKTEISMGTSRILSKDYMEIMSNKFKHNPFYCDYLKTKYFSDLNNKIVEFS
ncbi:DUF4435 domain-containing protein [Leuconostoc mesenteroides]|nr:DUF4435 domain-containing protein [Leuconostoc mesenteroides]